MSDPIATPWSEKLLEKKIGKVESDKLKNRTTSLKETTMNTKPKSYMPEEERQRLLASGVTESVLCVNESRFATKASDNEAAWRWLALADLPAYALRYLKKENGADFIRSYGFDTTPADKEYGPNWLDEA
ncbi:hypothetical protein [Brackiella oedipodis]|uniref:hypothetical protein n=1 Tax=Brackiella oedipodis TaxID=124225 RepID=UPI001B80E5B3|nr:hypothetical protein [Brackiella oedipodis]